MIPRVEWNASGKVGLRYRTLRLLFWLLLPWTRYRSPWDYADWGRHFYQWIIWSANPFWFFVHPNQDCIEWGLVYDFWASQVRPQSRKLHHQHCSAESFNTERDRSENSMDLRNPSSCHGRIHQQKSPHQALCKPFSTWARLSTDMPHNTRIELERRESTLLPVHIARKRRKYHELIKLFLYSAAHRPEATTSTERHICSLEHITRNRERYANQSEDDPYRPSSNDGNWGRREE